jgi:hypothetical protein
MTTSIPEKRYIPIVPSLPNGLKDAFNPSDMTPIAAAHPRQKGMPRALPWVFINSLLCTSCVLAQPLPMRRRVELLL